MPRVVLDTSVLVAAARSAQGASFALLQRLPWADYQMALSYPLYLEWRAVLTRPEHLPPGATAASTQKYLRYLASLAWRQQIYFRWRPWLRDPDDDFVLELAIAAQARHIVTHNVADFRNLANFGIAAITPREFLKLLHSPPSS